MWVMSLPEFLVHLGRISSFPITNYIDVSRITFLVARYWCYVTEWILWMKYLDIVIILLKVESFMKTTFLSIDVVISQPIRTMVIFFLLPIRW